jgi:O-antigen/teichoic acid export membrane protein
MSQSRTTKVIALSLGQTLTRLSGIVAAAVLSRILTQGDYATYRQTMLAYAFISPLIMLSLPQAIFYFFPKHEGNERQMLTENLSLLAAMGIIFTLFLFCGGNNFLALRFHNPDLERTLRYLAPYSLFMIPAGAMGACLVARNKIKALTISNVLTRMTGLTFVVFACVLFKSPVPIIIAEVLSSIILFIVAMWLMFSSCPGALTYPSLHRMFEMVKYSIPMGIAGMLGTISMQIDKIIVSSMCKPTEFATYANGAIEIPLIGIITGSITVVIITDMTKMCQQNNPQQALALFQNAALRSASILLPAMCFFLVTADEFIVALYSAKYVKSVTPFRLYLIILPIRIVFFGAAIMALGKTKYILIRSIFDLIINAMLSIILVYYMGYLGAIFATILTLYFWTVPFNLKIISQGFNTSFWSVLPLRDILLMLILSGLLVPLAYMNKYISGVHPAIQFGFSAIFYWPAILFVLFKFKYITIPQKWYSAIKP